jgi:hypothetical protein
MILLSAINWVVTAIIWLVAPIMRIYGLYALATGSSLVLLYVAWSAMRRNGRRRGVAPKP